MADNTKLGVAFALSLALLGCGGAQRKGADAYEHADYGAAMVQWRYLESSEAKMSDKARVRYFVYRGLTHYRLFQRSNDPAEAAAALQFLARAQLGYDAGKPRWLDAETVSDMKVALGDLARRAAGGPGPWVQPTVVVVRAEPPGSGAPDRKKADAADEPAEMQEPAEVEEGETE